MYTVPIKQSKKVHEILILEIFVYSLNENYLFSYKLKLFISEQAGRTLTKMPSLLKKKTICVFWNSWISCHFRPFSFSAKLTNLDKTRIKKISDKFFCNELKLLQLRQRYSQKLFREIQRPDYYT